ncbi:MAG: SUMF1/EgtB/PvdO family nonheme iron enzyme [Candidatus ainarchaeum sp.]|nr:SUMF1/EgtB/PvdO family nonheme iron enzyme [Candidatus ainarchaeum sp.]
MIKGNYFITFFKKRKAISPLIATILLVVVAVAIIGIIISWGKGFTNDSLSKASGLEIFTESETSFYLHLKTSINGRTILEYKPPYGSPHTSLTITGYSLFGNTNINPIDPPITITANQSAVIDHGILEDNLNIVFYLDNDRMITKNNILQTIKQPSSCPEGYIPVPGNHLYGTMNENGGFCVSKYEMKMDVNGDGKGNLVADYPDCNTGSLTYNTYSYELCPTPGTLVSTPEGSPVTRISQTEAIAACEAIGGHLITNNEWMTIVRNIEQVPSNWSSGTVGQGYIYSGHNDGTPGGALEASIDTNGYAGTGQSSGSQRRTLTLTNGEVIWDLAGNVRQWTSDTIQRKDQPDGFNNADDSNFITGFNYFDYSKGGGENQYISSDNLGNTTLKYKDLFLLTSNTYNATDNGVGRIYTYSDVGDTSTAEYAFLRGGHWGHGTDAGVLSLTLLDTPGSRDRRIGLRCVK